MKKLFILLFALTLISHQKSLGQCFMAYVDDDWIIGNTTGDSELDQILYTQEADLESFFGLNVNMFFGTERSMHGNAFFSPYCNSFNCSGQIVLGTYLMQEVAAKGDGYMRLVAVMAHEFGHALQHKYGWSGNSKLRELHADFLAGFYVGNLNTISESEFIASIDEFCDRADIDFNSPDPHGTAAERGCAFLQGFKHAQTTNNLYSAYTTGKQYVIANNPCYKYQQTTSRPGYYIPSSANSEYATLAGLAIIIGATVLLSNDIYYRRVYSFRNPNPDDSIGFRNGNGWHFGFRKQFNRSALEYGVSSTGFKSKDELFPSFERQTFFNINYVHDLSIQRLPQRIRPYIGAGLNLGDGAGICGIAGIYIPLVDRFKFDLRYEIGNKVNQLQFGLIFKYQKEYLWNK